MVFGKQPVEQKFLERYFADRFGGRDGKVSRAVPAGLPVHLIFVDEDISNGFVGLVFDDSHSVVGARCASFEKLVGAKEAPDLDLNFHGCLFRA